MANNPLELDDGTEGANVGYRSYQPPTEESDDDDDAHVDFEEDEDDLNEEDDDEEHEDENKNKDEELDTSRWSPEVKKAFSVERKRMERMFEKRLSALAPQRELMELAGALQEDPKGTIAALARKYGITLADDVEGDEKEEELAPPGKDEPLDSYIKRAVAHGVKAALKEKGGDKKIPSSAEVDDDLTSRRTKAAIAQRVAYLNAMYGDEWKGLQEEMSQILRQTPELRDDLDKLVAKARALKKGGGERKKEKINREKSRSRRFSTGERGTGQVRTRKPKGKMSFNEAWEASKRELSRR